MKSNFCHLAIEDKVLFRLAANAERYFKDDPNTTLIKLRQLGEFLIQEVASRFGVNKWPEETQLEMIRRLEANDYLERDIAVLFHQLRKSGNDAAHNIQENHSVALSSLKVAWQLSLWFHRTFYDSEYKSGPFNPPEQPKNENLDLLKELKILKENLSKFESKEQELAAELRQKEQELSESLNLQKEWESIAEISESDNSKLAERIKELQEQALLKTPASRNNLKEASKKAANLIKLDEAETREIIDQQLRDAGWEANTKVLRHSKGTRPEKNKNIAIAEWPTKSGPADYILFMGLDPVGAIEAKRSIKDVSGSVGQAERYCKDYEKFSDKNDHPTIPFAFSTNGRPYLRQIETKSGIWFRDTRQKNNLAKSICGWYSPEGLKQLVRQNKIKAHNQLKSEKFEYGFEPWRFQKKAIKRVEKAIIEGQENILLAMATGTGKTKTCVALIYRLLKANRFRRILFLVDRQELADQAANAFKETLMESMQTFAEIYGIKEYGEQDFEANTRVHIATIQAMMKRILFSKKEDPLSIDSYDLIVVDECHRGYLLDRELSERELNFRDFNSYISKYRHILEYFDAVKIGLTATPALHSVDIFGKPVFTYTYREAVIDGYLVDHEPPLLIKTNLSSEGIKWKAGDDVMIYQPETASIDHYQTPDELEFDVDKFNKKVITKPFNEVVCKQLAKEIDPQSLQKTLIFCATDQHADDVVYLLKKALENQYGSVDDDSVKKITGASDKPKDLIRRYKNERQPNIAVTVDLLSTGVDVPEICNIVFLRRVKSRILYDQMIGRATRLCSEINKTHFRIFDAVGIYKTLQPITEMKPVVINPSISFNQLQLELSSTEEEVELKLIRDQFIAKLQRKRKSMDDESRNKFKELTGSQPIDFIEKIKDQPPRDTKQIIKNIPGLGDFLDQSFRQASEPIFISDHKDSLLSTQHGYGGAEKPEDYLEGFKAFIQNHGNEIPALKLVLTRPWELNRKDLKELRLKLDQEGYNETTLATAWRDTTNQEIVSSIMGYIRQAALGNALIPYEQRVDQALQKILTSKSWSSPQRQWLQKIANQTKTLIIIDREIIDDKNLYFSREGGGWNRLNKIFDNQLEDILTTFQQDIWAA